jgi:hypothetical protein
MSGSRAPTGEVVLRALLWLLLGGWVGSWLCFGLLIAPTAFRVLPTTELAGRMVGPVLTGLNLYAAATGLLLALLAARLGRGRLLVVLPLLAAAICVFSELVITARIEAIRPLVFGAQGSEELAARFQTLHRVSVWLFCAVGATTLAMLWGHAHADAPRLVEGDPP